MTDATNGLDALESRFQRRQRTVPPPRRPRDETAEPVVTQPTEEKPPDSDSVQQVEATSPARTRQSRRTAYDHVEVGPGDQTSHLFVRVRKPLDNHLADLVTELRRGGIRTSKLELIEMLLWELPMDADGELRRRLGAFRRAAPREEQL